MNDLLFPKLEIYLDVETLRLAHEVEGGWQNIPGFGLSVAVTWDEANAYRTWWEADCTKLIDELGRFDRIVTFNGERFDFQVLGAYGKIDHLRPRSFDVLVDLTKRLGHRVKLESVAQHTLGRGKGGSGVDAVAWWREGRTADVAEYCRQDVEILVEIVRFARQKGHVLIDPARKVAVGWT
ncbi:MAG: ribonuclease H-like domain-containing protein [Acidobacteria bacterium]|nr:ribonuclease H-like domain-containing protein [Acidobacteriota bacterium]